MSYKAPSGRIYASKASYERARGMGYTKPERGSGGRDQPAPGYRGPDGRIYASEESYERAQELRREPTPQPQTSSPEATEVDTQQAAEEEKTREILEQYASQAVQEKYEAELQRPPGAARPVFIPEGTYDPERTYGGPVYTYPTEAEGLTREEVAAQVSEQIPTIIGESYQEQERAYVAAHLEIGPLSKAEKAQRYFEEAATPEFAEYQMKAASPLGKTGAFVITTTAIAGSTLIAGTIGFGRDVVGGFRESGLKGAAKAGITGTWETVKALPASVGTFAVGVRAGDPLTAGVGLGGTIGGALIAKGGIKVAKQVKTAGKIGLKGYRETKGTEIRSVRARIAIDPIYETRKAIAGKFIIDATTSIKTGAGKKIKVFTYGEGAVVSTKGKVAISASKIFKGEQLIGKKTTTLGPQPTGISIGTTQFPGIFAGKTFAERPTRFAGFDIGRLKTPTRVETQQLGIAGRGRERRYGFQIKTIQYTPSKGYKPFTTGRFTMGKTGTKSLITPAGARQITAQVSAAALKGVKTKIKTKTFRGIGKTIGKTKTAVLPLTIGAQVTQQRVGTMTKGYEAMTGAQRFKLAGVTTTRFKTKTMTDSRAFAFPSSRIQTKGMASSLAFGKGELESVGRRKGYKRGYRVFASPTAALFNIRATRKQRKQTKFTGLEIIGLR